MPNQSDTSYRRLEGLYSKVKGILLALPSVKVGTRFGFEAFFVGKKFFSHIHSTKRVLLVEARLDKLDVKGQVLPPGATPHPQYSQFGWVRISLGDESDLSKAELLLKRSHAYVMSLPRNVWLARQANLEEKVRRINENFPSLKLQVKHEASRKKVCITVIPSDHLNQRSEVEMREAVRALRHI